MYSWVFLMASDPEGRGPNSTSFFRCACARAASMPWSALGLPPGFAVLVLADEAAGSWQPLAKARSRARANVRMAVLRETIGLVMDSTPSEDFTALQELHLRQGLGQLLVARRRGKGMQARRPLL